MLLGAFMLPVFTLGNFILDTFLVVLYFPFIVATWSWCHTSPIASQTLPVGALGIILSSLHGAFPFCLVVS